MLRNQVCLPTPRKKTAEKQSQNSYTLNVTLRGLPHVSKWSGKARELSSQDRENQHFEEKPGRTKIITPLIYLEETLQVTVNIITISLWEAGGRYCSDILKLFGQGNSIFIGEKNKGLVYLRCFLDRFV